MLLETAPIHSEVGYPMWWLALAVGLAVLGVGVLVVGIWRWRALAPGLPPVDDSLRRARDEALAAIDRAAEHSLDPRAACREITRVTRRFIGLVSNGDADYLAARRLRRAARLDPRLQGVADLVSHTQATTFAPDARPDVGLVADQAREVVRSWR